MPVADDLREVASEVDSWDTDAAARLKALAAAVADGGDANPWRGLDVIGAISPALVAETVRGAGIRSRSLAWAERLRNVIVLVPITITWVGLFYAAAAYRAAVALHPELITRPFLLLWEEGFVGALPLPFGLDAFLRLSSIAILDVTALGGLIGLTWLIHGRTNVDQARRERLAHDLEQRVHHVAWRAASLVALRTEPDTLVDHIRSMADGLLSELRAERERVGELASERERETANLTAFSKGLRAGAESLQRTATGSAATLANIEKISAGLDGQLVSLADKENHLAAVIGQAATAIKEQGVQQGDLSRDMRDSLQLLIDTAERAANEQARFAASAQSLQLELVGLRGDLANERQSYSIAAAAANDAATKMEAALASTGAIADAAVALGETNVTLARVANALSEGAAQQLRATATLPATLQQLVASLQIQRQRSDTSFDLGSAAPTGAPTESPPGRVRMSNPDQSPDAAQASSSALGAASPQPPGSPSDSPTNADRPRRSFFGFRRSD